MEQHSNLVRKLCLSLEECTTCRMQGLPIKQLLDLIVNFISEDVADEPIHEKLSGLHLKKSRLSPGKGVGFASHGDVSSHHDRVEISSEALYYKRLQNVTPTDDRSLSNPRGILQYRKEIANMQQQKWLCLQQQGSNMCGSSGRRDVVQLVGVLCRGLLEGSWRYVLKEISQLSEQIYEEGSPEQENMQTGIKLSFTMHKVRSYLSQTAQSPESYHRDNEKILKWVDEIDSKLPMWMKTSEKQCVVKSETEGSRSLIELCNFVNDFVKANSVMTEGIAAEKSELGGRLQAMVWRINERLEGYEDCLIQMLTQQDFWNKEEWIVCLENNISALGNHRICRHLCDVAIKMQSCNDTNLHDRVLKVFLSSFASMTPMIQNQICETIWSLHTSHTLFSTYMNQNKDTQQEMTTAFNRLVNVSSNEAGFEKAVGRVAVVALQMPSDTLRTAIRRAVSNSAATQSILKVLQLLPSLARLHFPDQSKPQLVLILQDMIDNNVDMTSTEEASLIQFVSRLIQPYQLSSSCPYQEQALLPYSVFMESCILPHLHCDTMDNHGNNVNSRLELSLKLLSTCMNSFESQLRTDTTTEWSTGTSTFPIILCLCDLLDNSIALWDSNITPDGKDLVNAILARLCQNLCLYSASHQEADDELHNCLEWLMNKSTGLHWTVQLQLRISLQDCLSEYKMVVPTCMFDLCDLSDEQWTPILETTEKESSSQSDQLIAFQQCCRISEQLTSKLLQKLNQKQTKIEFFQATLVATVTVLPQSSLLEMDRIFCALKMLIKDGALRVPLSSRFVVCLPMFDISEYKTFLCMCQLLSSCVTLLSSEGCEDWVSVPLWMHTIKGVVNSLKNLTSDVISVAQSSTSTNKSVPVFTLGQFFCNTCHMITLIPSDVTEQLYVLALNLLGRVEEMLPSNQNEREFDWTDQRRSMEMVINNIGDNEQRHTLMQKLSGLN